MTNNEKQRSQSAIQRAHTLTGKHFKHHTPNIPLCLIRLFDYPVLSQQEGNLFTHNRIPIIYIQFNLKDSPKVT